MNNIYLCGSISTQNTLNFIEDFNRLDFQNYITVYLNSEGGELISMYVIKDLLERYNQLVELVAVGNLMSAAFDLFFEVNLDKKRIVTPTIGMIHQSSNDIRVQADGKLRDPFTKAMKHDMLLDNKMHIKTLKTIGLNEEELKLFNNGEDVFFTTQRLQQFLKNAQVKNG